MVAWFTYNYDSDFLLYHYTLQCQKAEDRVYQHTFTVPAQGVLERMGASTPSDLMMWIAKDWRLATAPTVVCLSRFYLVAMGTTVKQEGHFRFACVCFRACVRAGVCACVCVCVYLSACVYVCVHMCACACACACACVRISVRVCGRVCVRVCVCVYDSPKDVLLYFFFFLFSFALHLFTHFSEYSPLQERISPAAWEPLLSKLYCLCTSTVASGFTPIFGILL
jgi:hypothetical protein